MQGASSAAAAAAARPDLHPPRQWLPAKAQLSMKSRLFSKNILYSRDLWAGCTATWTSTCVFASLVAAAAFVAYLLFLRFMVSRGSSQQMKPLWRLSTVLADDATINCLDNELDSDEYEDEENSSRSSSSSARSKERLALRRMLNRNEQGLTRRSSIVRITSSDPTSNLCENPIHVDLEPTTRRSFWPAPISSSPPAHPSNLNGTTAPSLVHAAGQRSSSGSGSPTPGATRRRKESGRLLQGEAGRRAHAASPSRSPLAASAALPVRPARARPVDARSPLARTAARNKRNSTSSLSSADGAASSNPKRPVIRKDASPRDRLQAASPGTSGEQEQLDGTPSMASEASFTAAPLDRSSAFLGDSEVASASACSSPTSSVFSISRVPSILKRKPQEFRTASLREIDLSYSITQRQASLSNVPPLGRVTNTADQPGLWQANSAALGSPAPPPYQSSQHELGSQSPPFEAYPAWSRQKERSVRLVEPDWRPHLDTHVRARERLETATRFAAHKMTSGTVGTVDKVYNQDHPDADEFWFERFTQSTAAAGRDWDWRKRRARLQRAAALGMALGQSGLAGPPDAAADLPGNVGKTDVQLQHEHGTTVEQTVRAAEAATPSARKKAASAPLITFTERELASASASAPTPMLKVDTESGRRIASRSSSDVSSLSPTLSGNGTPMSPTPSGMGTPLGGIFGGVLPSAGSFNAAMTTKMAQRRRMSDNAPVSPSVLEKKGLTNKNVRLRASATAAAGTPSSPSGSSPATSPIKESLASLQYQELSTSGSSLTSRSVNNDDLAATTSGPSSPPAGMSSSVSVPGRISSLSDTVGKKVGLSNLRGLRRGSSSRTEDFLHDSTTPAMDLVPNLPDFATGDAGLSSTRSLGGPPSAEGPRSSADAYSYTVPHQQVPLSRTDSLLRGNAGGLDRDSPAWTKLAVNKPPPLFSGGATMSKQASAPAAPTTQFGTFERLKEFDWERDSVSQGSSHSSDSLRRRMRSHTDTALEDALNTLTAASTASPPISRSRTRTGSRSSIMRSASGAIRTDLSQRRSSTRHVFETSPSSISSTLGSTRSSPKNSRKHSSSSSFSAEPDPQMQPERAPRGMAQRARSASLSSNASSLASGGSSRLGSRSNSFRGGDVRTGGLGLSMTSSNPSTPGVEGEGKKADPFSMTAMSGA